MRLLDRVKLLSVAVSVLAFYFLKLHPLVMLRLHELMEFARSGEYKSVKISPPLLSLCQDPPRDNCSFYMECLESHYHCGPKGYPLGYGQSFCEKFSSERSLLSPRGQQWMINTMHCLQESLIPDVNGSETCAQLERKAFGTHAKCYLQNGLCTLEPEDWVAIVEIVQFETLFDSWDAWTESMKASVGCVRFYWHILSGKLGR